MKKTLFGLLCVIFVSCSVSEPEIKEPDPIIVPNPTANFSYSPTTIRDGQSITFTNQSTDAISYKWDFGNNSTSTLKNPTQIFTQGTWTVTLTAFNSDLKTNVISKTINVLPPYKSLTITKYTISKISFVTSSGSGWDTSTGPDIYLKFMDNTTTYFETGYISDLKPTDIPYFVNVTIPFTSLSKTYTVNMYDYDGVLDDYMTSFSFNIPSLIPSYPTTVTLTSGNFEVTFTLQWNS